jgi:hypothetical protein
VVHPAQLLAGNLYLLPKFGKRTDPPNQSRNRQLFPGKRLRQPEIKHLNPDYKVEPKKMDSICMFRYLILQ